MYLRLICKSYTKNAVNSTIYGHTATRGQTVEAHTTGTYTYTRVCVRHKKYFQQKKYHTNF